MANCTSALSRSCPALASSSVNPPVGGASPTGGRTDFDGKFSAGKLLYWRAILVMSGFGRAILFLLRSRSSMRFLLASCGVKDTRCCYFPPSLLLEWADGDWDFILFLILVSSGVEDAR